MHVPSVPHALDDILNLHDFEPVAREVEDVILQMMREAGGSEA